MLAHIVSLWVLLFIISHIWSETRGNEVLEMLVAVATLFEGPELHPQLPCQPFSNGWLRAVMWFKKGSWVWQVDLFYLFILLLQPGLQCPYTHTHTHTLSFITAGCWNPLRASTVNCQHDYLSKAVNRTKSLGHSKFVCLFCEQFWHLNTTLDKKRVHINVEVNSVYLTRINPQRRYQRII